MVMQNVDLDIELYIMTIVFDVLYIQQGSGISEIATY